MVPYVELEQTEVVRRSERKKESEKKVGHKILSYNIQLYFMGYSMRRRINGFAERELFEGGRMNRNLSEEVSDGEIS